MDPYRRPGPQSVMMLAVTLLAGELVSGLWLLVVPRRRLVVPMVVFSLTSVLWSGWPPNRSPAG